MYMITRLLPSVSGALLCLAFVAPVLVVQAQSFPELERVLAKELNHDMTEDGRWVYFPEKKDIKPIDKPLVKRVIPRYDFYSVSLTNFLGYHVNASHCLVLFDVSRSKLILVEPMWYGDISKPFMELFVNTTFSDKESLMAFLEELKDLLSVGTGNAGFGELKYTPNSVTFDMVYPNGNAQTRVWRSLEVVITNNRIVAFKSTNPAMGETKTVK